MRELVFGGWKKEIGLSSTLHLLVDMPHWFNCAEQMQIALSQQCSV
jgi:hypothetical protein